jgi:hypothetical protein
MAARIRYVRGEWKVICDVCGRRFLSSDLRKRWDGMMVCSRDWETRQPQDFVRAKIDIQAAPWTRPQSTDSFVPLTSIIAVPPVPPGTFTP